MPECTLNLERAVIPLDSHHHKCNPDYLRLLQGDGWTVGIYSTATTIAPLTLCSTSLCTELAPNRRDNRRLRAKGDQFTHRIRELAFVNQLHRLVAREADRNVCGLADGSRCLDRLSLWFKKGG